MRGDHSGSVLQSDLLLSFSLCFLTLFIFSFPVIMLSVHLDCYMKSVYLAPLHLDLVVVSVASRFKGLPCTMLLSVSDAFWVLHDELCEFNQTRVHLVPHINAV